MLVAIVMRKGVHSMEAIVIVIVAVTTRRVVVAMGLLEVLLKIQKRISQMR